MTSVRLLPAVMISAALLLTLKVAGLATGAEPLVASVEAADGEPAEQAAMPEAEGGDSAAMPEAAAETPAEAGPVDLAAQPMPRRIESLEVLDALAARRRELDARAADLDMREKLLAAAEARIDGKIEELKTLKGDIDTALQVEEERGEERLQSLVKVY